MRAWHRFCICVLFGTIPLAGCASKKEAPCVYERKIEMRDLSAEAAQVENAFVLQTAETTSGRFACSLSVAKFTLDEAGGTVKFRRMTEMEEAGWVNATCGLKEVTDLQFLNPIDTIPNPPTLDYLCAAARDLHTVMLLIYAPNRFGPNSAQVLGVLYDANTGLPLASLHSSANFLDPEGAESPPDELKGDHRDIDAYYQAERAYERYVVQCLGALIKQDNPPPTTQPHRWSTPPSERWWIPRW
jgi:hypothetical protein